MLSRRSLHDYVGDLDIMQHCHFVHVEQRQIIQLTIYYTPSCSLLVRAQLGGHLGAADKLDADRYKSRGPHRPLKKPPVGPRQSRILSDKENTRLVLYVLCTTSGSRSQPQRPSVTAFGKSFGRFGGAFSGQPRYGHPRGAGLRPIARALPRPNGNGG